jgi:molybdenum cofactor cytidylyltransferase
LLPFRGKPLLGHLCEVAAGAARFDPVVVVLGAEAARIRREVGPMAARIVVNKNWRDGMGSSVRCGARACGACHAVLFMLCDQPFVTKGLLRRIVAVYSQAGGGIVACRYDGTFGPPVLFGAEFFSQLRAQPSAAGAKSIIIKNIAAARFVPFPRGAADIDTPTDWEKISRAKGGVVRSR